MKHREQYKGFRSTVPEAKGSAATRQPVQLPNQRCSHIMNVSSSLVGICLVIITSIHVFAQTEKTIIDQITGVATLLFMTSCILSFLSIRKPTRNNRRLENIADVVFLTGLSLLFVTTILLSFNLVK